MRDLVAKYQGEAEACKRHVLAADTVTADTRGLQQLVAAGNYRAAINHTALLLEMYGQGTLKNTFFSKKKLCTSAFNMIWFSAEYRADTQSDIRYEQYRTEPHIGISKGGHR